MGIRHAKSKCSDQEELVKSYIINVLVVECNAIIIISVNLERRLKAAKIAYAMRDQYSPAIQAAQVAIIMTRIH